MDYSEKIEKIKLLKRPSNNIKLEPGEFIVDRFEIGLNVFFANLFKWEGNGWDTDKHTFYFEVGVNCDNWQEGFNSFLDAIIERAYPKKGPYLLT